MYSGTGTSLSVKLIVLRPVLTTQCDMHRLCSGEYKYAIVTRDSPDHPIPAVMYASHVFTVLVSLLPAVLAQVVDPELVAKLRAAPTNVDRISLLSDGQVGARLVLRLVSFDIF